MRERERERERMMMQKHSENENGKEDVKQCEKGARTAAKVRGEKKRERERDNEFVFIKFCVSWIRR